MRKRLSTLLLLLALAGCAELSTQWENLDTTPTTTPSDGLREARRVGTSSGPLTGCPFTALARSTIGAWLLRDVLPRS